MAESLIKHVSEHGGSPEEPLSVSLTEMRIEVRAFAKGSRAVERAIGLVLDAAIAGNFATMCTYLTNLSTTNQSYLQAALGSHGLVLWNPSKNAALLF